MNGQVGRARFEAVVEHLLDGDGHDHLADGGQDRQREGDPEALAELRRQPQAVADGLDRTAIDSLQTLGGHGATLSSSRAVFSASWRS